MPRVLGSKENLLVVKDPLSGCSVGMYYRQPTTKERQYFMSLSVQRHKNKVTIDHQKARSWGGNRIITGVREGDFTRVVNGENVPMSSDPQSPHYCDDWKDVMMISADDLIMALGYHVFDTVAQIDDGDEIKGSDVITEPPLPGEVDMPHLDFAHQEELGIQGE